MKQKSVLTSTLHSDVEEWKFKPTQVGDYNVTLSIEYDIGNDTYIESKDSIIIVKDLPGISVLYPNGGEVLKINDEVEIKWEPDLESNVNIEVWKNDQKVKDIASNITNNGIFRWLIKDIFPGTDYNIKIISNTNMDLSDNAFIIQYKIHWEDYITINLIEIYDDPVLTPKGFGIIPHITNSYPNQIDEKTIKFDIELENTLPQNIHKLSINLGNMPSPCAFISEVPNDHTNRKLLLKIYSIESIPTNIPIEKDIIIEYPLSVSNQPFNVKKDAYSFTNFSINFSKYNIWLKIHLSNIQQKNIPIHALYKYFIVDNKALCYGITQSEIVQFHDINLKPLKYKNTDVSLMPFSDFVVIDNIINYHINQYFDYPSFWSKSDAISIVNKVKSNLKGNKLTQIGFTYSNYPNTIIHSVVAYKLVEQKDNNLHKAHIFIHENNNYPNDQVIRLDFDLKNNTYNDYNAYSIIKAKSVKIEEPELLKNDKYNNFLTLTNKISQNLFKDNLCLIITPRILKISKFDRSYVKLNNIIQSTDSIMNYYLIPKVENGIVQFKIDTLDTNGLQDRIEYLTPTNDSLLSFSIFEIDSFSDKMSIELIIENFKGKLINCDYNHDGIIDNTLLPINDSGITLLKSINYPVKNLTICRIRVSNDIVISILTPKKTTLHFKLLNLKGQTLLSYHYLIDTNKYNQINLNANNLKPGIYFGYFITSYGEKIIRKLYKLN